MPGIVEAGDWRAVPPEDGRRVLHHAEFLGLASETGGPEGGEGRGPQSQRGSGVRQGVGALEHVDVPAEADERVRCGEAADAAAEDRRLRCIPVRGHTRKLLRM